MTRSDKHKIRRSHDRILVKKFSTVLICNYNPSSVTSISLFLIIAHDISALMNHAALTQILSIIIFNETVFWFYVYAANEMTAIIADADEFNRDASDDECQTSTA